MSVRVMSLIFDRFPLGGTDRLVMLALADYANDEGASIYPSIPNLASKVGGHQPVTSDEDELAYNLSPRRLREILRKLVDDKWVVIDRRGRGGNPQDTTHYRINVARLNECQPLRHVAPLRATAPLRASVKTPAADRTGGVRSSVKTPATDRTQPIIIHQVNHQENHQGGDEILNGGNDDAAKNMQSQQVGDLSIPDHADEDTILSVIRKYWPNADRAGIVRMLRHEGVTVAIIRSTLQEAKSNWRIGLFDTKVKAKAAAAAASVAQRRLAEQKSQAAAMDVADGKINWMSDVQLAAIAAEVQECLPTDSSDRALLAATEAQHLRSSLRQRNLIAKYIDANSVEPDRKRDPEAAAAAEADAREQRSRELREKLSPAPTPVRATG